ncbi:radical SAM protein [Rhodalgimonas zhirmunskyi]|uniref:Radical SAM protein n=1 Tax=Rhodalgimonas zhirmunskyi TaxID=2964767 RepID=A0AAJ1X3Y8_9RHOB|nr:radical SAM protein [Rhodoalgimonas zhirmunskyi]MDQ2092569.1 radical SAM protein [Rhodoalgimonas zhirmunskyi]
MKDQHFNANAGKFQDPLKTADGQERAEVALSHPETLWFNTGTLCNITCANCYIESSPDNDALVYLTAPEAEDYLDQIGERNWPIREIGLTGGEPFMNPATLDIIEAALARGYEVLVLSNAMRPMQRPRIKAGLERLNAAYPGKLTLRVSIDHFSPEVHDLERGKGSFAITLDGMRWLRDASIRTAVAGRIAFGEGEGDTRAGFARLYAENDLKIDAQDPGITVLFPEMDMNVEVPEITTACWGILNKSPEDVMCSSSRMVVKRKGAARPVVLACTLLAYDEEFEMGHTLEEAERPVRLNHPHCAKFCVLGGASCSA